MKKFLLSLFAFVMGATAMFAEEVVIASGTFNGRNATYTEGWTTTGTGVGRTDCVIIGAGENIVSPVIDFTKYSSITINIKARRYGTLTGSKATIDASVGTLSLGTTNATGTNASTSLTAITVSDLSGLSSSSIVFTCTNATSAGSSHGAGVNSIVIKGVKKDEKYTREVVAETFGTICLPNAVAAEARSGATFYNIAGVLKSGETITGIALEEETGALVAGKPYVFQATDATLSATYSGDAVSEAVEATGLVGTLAADGITLSTEGKYILSNNMLRKLAGGTATIGQNRAYFDLDGVEVYNPAMANSGRIVFVETEEGAANSLEAVEAKQSQEIYDLTGRRVNVATKGMFIVNGKKVIVK